MIYSIALNDLAADEMTAARPAKRRKAGNQ
jgi:hypothetical protein